MEATIYRYAHETKQTLGTFILKKDGITIFDCYTLELPWRNNKFQESCIPVGKYKVVPRYSQKFKNHFHLLDVPNRTYILIHSGNYYWHILGCILIGDSHRDINSDGFRDVTNSKKTLDKLLSIAPKGFDLEIMNV